MRITLRAALLAALLVFTPAAALPQITWEAATALPESVQERVDLAVIERIRDEGFNRSQIEQLAGHLTDVIGPRLTGSPAMRQANDWTAERLREWGLTNVQVEPWGEFGRGWERVSYSGRILTPFVQPLYAHPVAWTGSTRGAVTCNAVAIEAERPEDLQRYRGRLRGACVLIEAPPVLPPEFERPPLRFPAEDIIAAMSPPEPPAEITPEEQCERERRAAELEAAFRQRQAVRTAMNEMFRGEGVAVILVPSQRPYGIIRLRGNAAGRDLRNPIPTPELVVSHEQYGQMWRNLGRGLPVRLELNVQNRFHDRDLQQYNTLGDLRGSDLAEEYVMIGAHLDSWHPGTGATDNAAGSVVMLEAMRILRALGVQPRRTIRIALWSGEEQGLFGSRLWVENNRELWPRISAYLNVDNGTGRIRGIWNQSNPLVTPIFEQLLWPFKDLGVVVVRHGNTGGTDHLSFDRVGIPGFNFIQDPIEYGTRTHHTHVDTFERLVLDDLRQAAVVVASTAYHLAMRDEMVPRKPGAAGAAR